MKYTVYGMYCLIVKNNTVRFKKCKTCKNYSSNKKRCLLSTNILKKYKL